MVSSWVLDTSLRACPCELDWLLFIEDRGVLDSAILSFVGDWPTRWPSANPGGKDEDFNLVSFGVSRTLWSSLFTCWCCSFTITWCFVVVDEENDSETRGFHNKTRVYRIISFIPFKLGVLSLLTSNHFWMFVTDFRSSASYHFFVQFGRYRQGWCGNLEL